MSAFDKLKVISKVSAPKQKIVPLKEKKRDSEKFILYGSIRSS